jgi:hypothetical protein
MARGKKRGLLREVVAIDISALLAVADDLSNLSPDKLAESAVSALNETAERTFTLARDRITEGVNLSDPYLRRRMEVVKADKLGLHADIIARGDTSELTRLATYDAKMVIVPRDTAGRNRNRGVLGIPKGLKQQGVNVTVMRGNEKTLDTVFLLRLRQGSRQGDKFGVFLRDGKRMKHLFGPSVYQLFAWQIPRISGEVADDLEKTLIDRVAEQLKDILK